MSKILLIEDTQSLAEELTDILTMEGYEIIVACDGIQGLEFLWGNRPDLILTDLFMPRLDGFEVIKCVRDKPDYDSIPIVILSATTSPAEQQRGIDLGANAFIQKPFKIHELLTHINRLLVEGINV